MCRILLLAAIPFGGVGSILALVIARAPFGFTAVLGIISLIGVIVSHVFGSKAAAAATAVWRPSRIEKNSVRPAAPPVASNARRLIVCAMLNRPGRLA